MYLKSVTIHRRNFPTHEKFPFNLKIFLETDGLDLSSPVTFFVGENGSGKSTLLDAIARRSGFLPWGGTKIHRVHNNPYETQLANYIGLKWSPRHPYGFHFRAEAFFNFAASLDDIILDDPGRDVYYGGGSLNAISHGESFLAFFKGYSFQLDGLYLLDEPEAALSPKSQAQFVKLIIDSLDRGKKQYIIATHSPIILGCPNSRILSFDRHSIEEISYRESGPYVFYRDFMDDPAKFYEF
ncbi:MAG TPA: AAA family ATPase [Desulfomonilaceae bacterium]|nr:AAA family ATPase [Desulfomonilaceae bacterium]